MAKYNYDGTNDYNWQARIDSAPSGKEQKRLRDKQDRLANNEPLEAWAAYVAGIVSGVIFFIFILSMGA